MALSKVLFARERIGRIQFLVEKRMKNELPFRAGTGCIGAALERRRANHSHAHEITEREAPRSNGDFGESLPFYQLHLSPALKGSRRKALEIRPTQPLTRDSRSRDKIPNDVKFVADRKINTGKS